MDPLVALGLIAEIASSIFPWKEILTGYQSYLHFKLKIREIDAELESLNPKVEAFKKYLDVKKEVVIKQLEEQRRYYESRLPIVKQAMENSFLTQDELRKVMSELRIKIASSSGESLISVNSAISIVAQQLSKESINTFNLIGKEVDLQIVNINSTQIEKLQSQLPKRLN